ncbi:transglycosylase domain-containing protein [Fulvimarina sp. 2208YS6-2-32]|uniref:peptidoglycan glycosyltransferase n=1 Tax=Fulvimarina uroteuthidis TaxID=3098149 RepID=A0ABU5HZM8_9HYPH|nr:transglycosylase domain-containing protein [Fulvimarina sp. 2208YS6-2-32]MDY8108586.1 transglycosylase domain-containing protein [Fulvimarina sp. 2208YS6-2-32]
MAARRQERIEPSFGGKLDATGDDDFRVTADDRAVPSAANDRARKTANAEPKQRRSFFGPRKAKAGRRSAGSGGGGDGGGGSRRRKRGFIGHLFRTGFTLAIWGALGIAVLLGYFAVQLPSEAWEIPDRPPNVKIVAVDGRMMANRGLTGGREVSLDEVSPFIPQAVMAIEDRRFYDHFGVDPIGIARAAFENYQAGATVQGGSTLTQQLAKNIFLSPEQSLQRKIQEAILSLWLEQKFTKNQIMEMYLNRVYFGSGSTGVEAASRRYFNKSAADVDLHEAALLAGLLKAPSRLSPARDPEAAKQRADIVLAAMREEGFIDEAEFKAAKAEEPTKAKSFWTGAENYAADVVMEDLKDLIGDVKEDVIVETTIDLDLEKEAEKVIKATVYGAKQNVSQGALVAIDGTGAIRALVGGVDYSKSQYNRAFQARRQPGSAFKPFVYQTAMEQGWRPETVLNDAPVQIGNWTPQNYDNRYRGPVTIAVALQNSLNTIAAQLIDAVGPASVIETANRMGIKSQIGDNAAIALGTSEVSLLELTDAFTPYSNGGYEAKPHLVNRVTSETGKVLWERGAEVPPVIVDPDTVAMMNAMLARVVSAGTGRRAVLDGWEAAGKTGTTNDYKDAWFIGYTANLTTGVWLGNDNGARMQKVTGGSLPAEAWHAFMTAAHEGLPPTPLPGGYEIGGPQAPQIADGSDGGFYDPEMAGASDQYYAPAGQIPPENVGGEQRAADGAARVFNTPPPPGVTVERRVRNPSLLESIFGM